MLQGSLVALITPMHSDGALDKRSLSNLLEWHINEGTKGFVIAGTTGESATLSLIEKRKLLEWTLDVVQGRVPVLVGTGSNDTRSTIDLTLEMENLGADGCLIVTPYYNRPTQEGLYHHFKLIAECAKKPLILYNVPSRTGCDLLPETVSRLVHFKNIAGIKEASDNMQRIKELVQIDTQNFCVLSGNDETNIETIEAGGHGAISVTANIAPRMLSEAIEAALKGQFEKAKMINNELLPLHHTLFIETNPIPTKWLLSKLKKIENGIRLPLTTLQSKFHNEVYASYKKIQDGKN